MRATPLAAAFALAASPALAQTVPALPTAMPAAPVAAGTTPRTAVPATMPPPLPTMSPSAHLAPRERKAVRMATRWRRRSCGTSMGADGVLEISQGACEPTLVCAPFHWCDVALEPGEGPTDVPDIGDPRWKMQLRWSVKGMRRTLHIRFKPDDAGLDANFMLTTNQRTVTLRLQSHRTKYMPFLHLANPEAASRRQWLQAIAQGAAGGGARGASCDAMPSIPPTAFEIDPDRDARAWAPVQVYAVTSNYGIRTCIDFPANIGSIDLPVLVVRDASGNQQLVTSRLVGRRMEVDALVNRAELVTGVGSSQVSVEITRKEYR